VIGSSSSPGLSKKKRKKKRTFCTHAVLLTFSHQLVCYRNRWADGGLQKACFPFTDRFLPFYWASFSLTMILGQQKSGQRHASAFFTSTRRRCQSFRLNNMYGFLNRRWDGSRSQFSPRLGGARTEAMLCMGLRSPRATNSPLPVSRGVERSIFLGLATILGRTVLQGGRRSPIEWAFWSWPESEIG